MSGEKKGKKRCTAIVLAAGQGSRMGTKIQKQYLEIEAKPVLYYSLAAFEASEIIDDVILVTGEDQIEYCRKEIVEKYHFKKVDTITAGGKERYESVYRALLVMEEDDMYVPNRDGYVFIHDGARPFVDEAILERAYDAVRKYRACVVGMPSKDTIKIVDENGFSKETPDRRSLWQVQTPQVFETALIKDAYFKLMRESYIQVTDDAMAVEKMAGMQVKLVEGSYKNLKITTPEDLPIAEVFARELNQEIKNKKIENRIDRTGDFMVESIMSLR